jgi:hypothetical protein
MLRFLFPVWITFAVIITASVCVYYKAGHKSANCLGCHEGIEEVSENHRFPCAECHTDNIDYAHSGNNLDGACGKCHDRQINAVRGSVMFTNSGIIKNIGLVWADAGEGMPAELYGKYCSICHLSSGISVGGGVRRSSGCAACHAAYNRSGSYEGGDKSMKGKRPYPETHRLLKLPTDDRCAACHNRGGRLALSYGGLYDGNNSRVPTQNGGAGPVIVSGGRSVRNMTPDIHSAGGMGCIDCHTQSEVMGDGESYEDMFHQTEIACVSCHGDGEALPGVPLTSGKGRVLSNALKQNGEYWLLAKQSGELKKIKTVRGTPEHGIAGHERLDCASCHSRVIVQCYGCHIRYDEREDAVSYLTGETTPGAFSETEDVRLFFPFPLAVNKFGKITPVTPGRRSFFTHIDAEGKVIKDDALLEYHGDNRDNPKFAPFFGHNLGKKAVTCAECHGNPYFYGFGDGLFSAKGGGDFTSPLMGDTGSKPLNALYSISGGGFYTAAAGENARFFSKEEIIKIINVNRCIVCHETPEYFTEKRDYEKVLSDSVHSSVLR